MEPGRACHAQHAQHLHMRSLESNLVPKRTSLSLLAGQRTSDRLTQMHAPAHVSMSAYKSPLKRQWRPGEHCSPLIPVWPPAAVAARCALQSCPAAQLPAGSHLHARQLELTDKDMWHLDKGPSCPPSQVRPEHLPSCTYLATSRPKILTLLGLPVSRACTNILPVAACREQCSANSLTQPFLRAARRQRMPRTAVSCRRGTPEARLVKVNTHSS